MTTATLLERCASKYHRVNVRLHRFLSENDFVKSLPAEVEIPFSVYRGLLTTFFQNHGLVVGVFPIFTYGRRTWEYKIYYEGEDFSASGYAEREAAEWSAFERAFQFLDTTFYVEDIKNRFYDYRADTSPCNINWEHLRAVLCYRRKNLITA